MAQWEYQRYSLTNIDRGGVVNQRSTIMADLNALGEDGWEVIAVWPDGQHVLMKRPKQATKEG
jgi:hypothetical protein